MGLDDELPWVDITAPDNFFIPNKINSQIKQWLDANCGQSAESLSNLKYGDSYSWYPLLIQLVTMQHSMFRIYFKKPQHAILFKLKWDTDGFLSKVD